METLICSVGVRQLQLFCGLIEGGIIGISLSNWWCFCQSEICCFSKANTLSFDGLKETEVNGRPGTGSARWCISLQESRGNCYRGLMAGDLYQMKRGIQRFDHS